MKILIYSDLHIYNHHKLSVNSETALDVLDQINEYAIENGIDKVVSAGDFFHTKARAYAPHVIQAWLRVKHLYKSNIKKIMLIGNHDMASPNSTMNSILFAFSDYAKIVPDYWFFDTESTRMHFLSYTEKAFDSFMLSKEKQNVLIGHLDIIGFKMSNGFRSDHGFKPDDFSEFDLVISGHYHQFQNIKNILYVGSPYQTSFAERDQEKGFIVLDTEDLAVEFVELSGTPKYKIVEIDDINDIEKKDVENNFVRIKVKNQKISKTKLKETMIEHGAVSVDIVPVESAHEIEEYYESDLGNDPFSIAKQYLASLSNNSLDSKELIKYFEKIQEISSNIADYEI